ncbi:unnamed protein product [Gongylonema pulchrum]|uniref:HDAC_interact domain-containing protein n=1 Tax=Gongylonema pulchrum TaxID=637853 RepID=A0A183E009_9BILA|nr:unnamed protein product [Gongylonema pulchrum]
MCRIFSDYATSRKLGPSYRALPDSYEKPLCSGRTPLCDSVLNDRWVSFPSWSSEESSCVLPKKTEFEEFMFRTDDERYELDIIIEINKTVLDLLLAAEARMSNMTKEQLSKFQLNEALNGDSPATVRMALKRIYGEHAHKMLESLMQNPQILVPKLIDRMQKKDEEWRTLRGKCNKVWRCETEKYYAKSLSQQSFTFKQRDYKRLRPRNIISQYENWYEEVSFF